jgi:diaminopimelate decarboxylase
MPEVWQAGVRGGAVGQGVLVEPAAARRIAHHPSGFALRNGVLHCDGVTLDRLAADVGTPAYVYSASAIRAQYAALADALDGVPHRVHYSVKANSNLAILRLLRELGAGVDIVSGGELHRSLAAGYAGGDVVFSGVGKTYAELAWALRAEVKLINVESDGELDVVARAAADAGRPAPVALRVNPEVTVDTPHPYTRTGERGMKFGIPYDRALDVARRALGLSRLRLVGLDMHIGSQVSQLEPYRLGIAKLLELLAELRRAGADELRYLDVGGGLAVSYDDEPAADVRAFGAAVSGAVSPTGLEVIVEPGRYLVGNAGILVTRVLDRKHSGGKEYVITDAGMNDLLRPSHYHAFHRIEAVTPSGRRAVADIVGPVCESGDFLALDRDVDDVVVGDLLAVHSAGAYGFVMASNYNSRPRAAEVLVDGDRFAIVRERETYDDLVRHERGRPEWRRL